VLKFPRSFCIVVGIILGTEAGSVFSFTTKRGDIMVIEPKTDLRLVVLDMRKLDVLRNRR